MVSATTECLEPCTVNINSSIAFHPPCWGKVGAHAVLHPYWRCRASADAFAGEGVNQALEGAMLLSRAILGANGDKAALDGKASAFEDAMLGRVKKLQQLSNDLLQDWMFAWCSQVCLVESDQSPC